MTKCPRIFRSNLTMEKCFQAIRRKWKTGLFAMIGWWTIHGVALAQATEPKKEAEGGSYVLSYMLVVLAIALGLMGVCRASQRRDRARSEHYDQSKSVLKK
jgi:hypothetical protein